MELSFWMTHNVGPDRRSELANVGRRAPKQQADGCLALAVWLEKLKKISGELKAPTPGVRQSMEPTPLPKPLGLRERDCSCGAIAFRALRKHIRSRIVE